MSFSKPTCFISYNTDDMDFNSLNKFKDWLLELSDAKLDLLYALDLGFGKDLDKFMKKLYEVDAAIIMMSPGYKNKVINKTGGVFTEYKYIYQRYIL